MKCRCIGLLWELQAPSDGFLTLVKYHWYTLLYSTAVNNAGIGAFTVVECTPMSLAKELFEVNYFGALRLIQAVLPNMKARQGGHIINNSSTMGVVGTPFSELYCSTKFAIEGLTEALAPTLLHFNIR